ncbi:MAG: hypothetical protein HLX50_23760 [Alteromonadaceae bacterium]|nr:hypothetical protein [Alteromonadaceae bacterium]
MFNVRSYTIKYRYQDQSFSMEQRTDFYPSSMEKDDVLSELMEYLYVEAERHTKDKDLEHLSDVVDDFVFELGSLDDVCDFVFKEHQTAKRFS